MSDLLLTTKERNRLAQVRAALKDGTNPYSGLYEAIKDPSDRVVIKVDRPIPQELVEKWDWKNTEPAIEIGPIQRKMLKGGVIEDDNGEPGMFTIDMLNSSRSISPSLSCIVCGSDIEQSVSYPGKIYLGQGSKIIQSLDPETNGKKIYFPVHKIGRACEHCKDELLPIED